MAYGHVTATPVDTVTQKHDALASNCAKKDMETTEQLQKQNDRLASCEEELANMKKQLATKDSSGIHYHEAGASACR